MVKIKDIEECIDYIFNLIKDSISNNKINFSRIEKYDIEKRKQWLLSIVLIETYTKDEIDEIVLESNLIDVNDEYKIIVDLSYGNGFILKDSFLIISKKSSVNKEEMLKYIYENLYNTIASEISFALNSLT